MPNRIEIGQQFGLWTVTEAGQTRSPDGHRRWRCVCRCGTAREVLGTSLKQGKSLSCGCLNGREQHGQASTNGKTPEYRIWMSMKARCKYPNRACYKAYGGRGIRVCERWEKSFTTFLADMGPRPTDRHTIERIDNDGNYEPGNCRWATYKEQSRNRSDNHLITFRGETKPLIEWAEITGISHKVINNRINRGKWSVERALTVPPEKSWCKEFGYVSKSNVKVIEYLGQAHSIAGWAEIIGMNYYTLARRLRSPGYTIERAMTAPRHQKLTDAAFNEIAARPIKRE